MQRSLGLKVQNQTSPNEPFPYASLFKSMLRLFICVLVLLHASADTFEAGFHDVSMQEYDSISKSIGHDLESACESEVLSFMQKHVHHVHGNRFSRFMSFSQPSFTANALATGEAAPHHYEKEANLAHWSSFGRQRFVVLISIVIVLVLGAGLSCYLLDPPFEDPNKDSPSGEIENRRNEELPCDTLGFMICAIVRDGEALATGTTRGHRWAKISRLITASLILLVNVALQVYLFSCILAYIVPPAVAELSHAYNEYERIMYPNHTVIANGLVRGVDGYFEPLNFAKLGDDLKQRVCTSTFAQPCFFQPLLLIWTLNCLREMKGATDQIYMLIIKMPTVPSMKDSLHTRLVDTGVVVGGSDKVAIIEVKTIVGLTYAIKLIVFFIILLPRVFITGFLCWLGSRWLAAADDFGNLVLDTVALEFLLLLKVLLYHTVISDRNRRDMNQTQVRPETHTERTSMWIYASTMGWIFLALGWTGFYVNYFQMVLIDYRFDLPELCTSWTAANYPAHIVR